MILESLSRHIAKKIKEYDPEGPGSIAVLEYGIGIKMNLYFGILLTVIFGMLFSDLLHSVLALLSFMTIRKYSGGVHLPITICAIVTGLAASLIPLFNLSSSAILVTNIVSVSVMVIFSPNNYEDESHVEFGPWSKFISVIIVSTNFLFESSILAIAFLAQSILVVPIYSQKGGEE